MPTPNTLAELLNEAEVHLNRGATDDALRCVVRILNQIAAGQVVISHDDAGIRDDIEHLDTVAVAAAAAGDDNTAKKASQQANMLKSAEKIAEQTETPSEAATTPKRK